MKSFLEMPKHTHGLLIIPNKEYHEDNNFLGSTGVKNWLKNPFIAQKTLEKKEQDKLNDDVDKETKEAFRFGSFYHSLILEPETTDTEFYVINPENRPDKAHTMASNANKAWAASFDDGVRTKMSIKDYDKILEMKDVLFEYSTPDYSIKKMIVQDNRPEESFFCEDFVTLIRDRKEFDKYEFHSDFNASYYVEDTTLKDAVECKMTETGKWVIYNEDLSKLMKESIVSVNSKVRPDINTSLFIGDLKTCQSNDLYKWKRAVADRDYDLSASYYIDVYYCLTGKRKPFWWITQEKNFPFNVEVYNVSDGYLENGRYKYLSGIFRLLKYKVTGNLEGYIQKPINQFAITVEPERWS